MHLWIKKCILADFKLERVRKPKVQLFNKWYFGENEGHSNIFTLLCEKPNPRIVSQAWLHVVPSSWSREFALPFPYFRKPLPKVDSNTPGVNELDLKIQEIRILEKVHYTFIIGGLYEENNVKVVSVQINTGLLSYKVSYSQFQRVSFVFAGNACWNPLSYIMKLTMIIKLS